MRISRGIPLLDVRVITLQQDYGRATKKCSRNFPCKNNITRTLNKFYEILLYSSRCNPNLLADKVSSHRRSRLILTLGLQQNIGNWEQAIDGRYHSFKPLDEEGILYLQISHLYPDSQLIFYLIVEEQICIRKDYLITYVYLREESILSYYVILIVSCSSFQCRETPQFMGIGINRLSLPCLTTCYLLAIASTRSSEYISYLSEALTSV